MWQAGVLLRIQTSLGLLGVSLDLGAIPQDKEAHTVCHLLCTRCCSWAHRVLCTPNNPPPEKPWDNWTVLPCSPRWHPEVTVTCSRSSFQALPTLLLVPHAYCPILLLTLPTETVHICGPAPVTYLHLIPARVQMEILVTEEGISKSSHHFRKTNETVTSD